MARYIEVDREAQCGLCDVPVIGAGAVSDALCCQGPKRDFAAEADFRLRNAVDMYPPGYSLVPTYGYNYPMPHVVEPPRYVQHVSPTPTRVAPAMTSQRQAVEPPHYPSYPAQATPQLSTQVYTYEHDIRRHYIPEAAPCTTPRFDRPLYEDFRWGRVVPAQNYSLEMVGPVEAMMVTTSTTQPGGTPRGEGLDSSWPRTVEVVNVEEQASEQKKHQNSDKVVKEKDNNKREDKSVEPKAEKEATVASKAPAPNKKAVAKKSPRLSKQNAQPGKEIEEEKQQKDGKEPKLEEREKSASKPSLEEHFTSESQQQGEDEVSKKKGEPEAAEVEASEGSASKGKKANEVDLKGKKANEVDGELKGEKEEQSPDEPSVADETESQVFDPASDAKIRAKSKAEALQQDLPAYPITSPPPRAGFEPVTACQVEGKGEASSVSVGETKLRIGGGSDWPVGYVPPADNKYKELVVGNQVYLEGGTFYLSETGAYLLGLRD